MRTVGGSKSTAGLADQSEYSREPGMGTANSDHTHQYAQEAIDLAYQGSWNTFPGAGRARCYKVGNFVQMDGWVRSGGADLIICNIPFDYRPDPVRLPLSFTSWALDSLGSMASHLVINSIGDLSIDNLGWTSPTFYDYVTLTGVRYIFK